MNLLRPGGVPSSDLNATVFFVGLPPGPAPGHSGSLIETSVGLQIHSAPGRARVTLLVNHSAQVPFL